jgi:ribonuclease PH
MVLILAPFQPLEAQPVPKDAAYWTTYVGQMKPYSTIKIRLHNGDSFRGRILEVTADDIEIMTKRWFASGVSRRVRYIDVKDLARTHPSRNAAIAGAVVAVWLFTGLVRTLGAH